MSKCNRKREKKKCFLAEMKSTKYEILRMYEFVYTQFNCISDRKKNINSYRFTRFCMNERFLFEKRNILMLEDFA